MREDRQDGDIMFTNERLIENGRLPKLALTARVRKLLTMLNAILRDGQPWNETKQFA